MDNSQKSAEVHQLPQKPFDFVNSTAAQKFAELARLAEATPEKYERVIILHDGKVTGEDLDPEDNSVDFGVCIHGPMNNAYCLGLLETAKLILFRAYG